MIEQEQTNQAANTKTDPNPTQNGTIAPSENTRTQAPKNNKMPILIAVVIVTIIIMSLVVFLVSQNQTGNTSGPIPTIRPTNPPSTPSPTTVVDEVEAVDVQDTTPTDFVEIEQDLQDL